MGTGSNTNASLVSGSAMGMSMPKISKPCPTIVITRCGRTMSTGAVCSEATNTPSTASGSAPATGVSGEGTPSASTIATSPGEPAPSWAVASMRRPESDAVTSAATVTSRLPEAMMMSGTIGTDATGTPSVWSSITTGRSGWPGKRYGV
jgi:hypothetical protein